MKKRVLVTAAAVCLAMLLSGCSAIVEKLGERFFEDESSPSSSSSSSSSPSFSSQSSSPSFSSQSSSPSFSSSRSSSPSFSSSRSSSPSFSSSRSFSPSESTPAAEENGFMINNCFIPYDTEKLAVSNFDSLLLSIDAGDFIPNDCKIAAYKSGVSSQACDLAEVAAKLPNLKELYLYKAIVINQESIADMKDLEALSYYVLEDIRSYEAIPDCPFKELKNLRSLRLYADYDDYSFLSEMPQLTDIHIDINAAKHDPSFFFEYPAITSLKINLLGNNPNFSLDGIEKLKNLKKLDIDCLTLDFTPLGKLENLEELEIECWNNAINISELSKAPKLKTLHLSYMDGYDWGFLQQMENLTDLSLSYVSGIRNSDIEPLKQLKSLTLDNSGCGVSVVAKLPNLESYSESMSEGGDFSSLKNCPNLRKLYLSECRSGEMDCAYIQNAPLEKFDCWKTEIANVELLANIKTLKKITIYTDEPKAEWSNILKEALPDCQISIH